MFSITNLHPFVERFPCLKFRLEPLNSEFWNSKCRTNFFLLLILNFLNSPVDYGEILESTGQQTDYR